MEPRGVGREDTEEPQELNLALVEKRGGGSRVGFVQAFPFPRHTPAQSSALPSLRLQAWASFEGRLPTVPNC